MRVFKHRQFSKFAVKQRISDAELLEAVQRAERGLIDADLGGGVIKQRIARAGQGRRGSYRSIILFKSGDKAFFIYGYSRACPYLLMRRYFWYKSVSAALKILARCSTLRGFLPCIHGFLLKKPLGKANRDTP